MKLLIKISDTQTLFYIYMYIFIIFIETLYYLHLLNTLLSLSKFKTYYVTFHLTYSYIWDKNIYCTLISFSYSIPQDQNICFKWWKLRKYQVLFSTCMLLFLCTKMIYYSSASESDFFFTRTHFRFNLQKYHFYTNLSLVNWIRSAS